jgi:hypothetical protein
MAKDPERYLSNPLNSYLLIKRLTADVDSIFDSVGSLAEGNWSDEIVSHVSMGILFGVQRGFVINSKFFKNFRKFKNSIFWSENQSFAREKNRYDCLLFKELIIDLQVSLIWKSAWHNLVNG